MSTEHCRATVFGPRMQSRPCQRRGVVEHEGRVYCKQHDPVAVQARNDAMTRADQERWTRAEQIKAEGVRLAQQLGCGWPYYHWTHATYTEHLVLSFHDAEQLIARLAQTKDSQ